MNNKILKEVTDAYGDLNNLKTQNLGFKASEFVPRDTAFAIIEKAISRGYNEFNPSLIKKFGKDTEIQIAREGSVCLYVKGNDLPTLEELNADEYHNLSDGTTRIWWD